MAQREPYPRNSALRDQMAAVLRDASEPIAAAAVVALVGEVACTCQADPALMAQHGQTTGPCAGRGRIPVRLGDALQMLNAMARKGVVTRQVVADARPRRVLWSLADDPAIVQWRVILPLLEEGWALPAIEPLARNHRRQR